MYGFFGSLPSSLNNALNGSDFSELALLEARVGVARQSPGSVPEMNDDYGNIHTNQLELHYFRKASHVMMCLDSLRRA